MENRAIFTASIASLRLGRVWVAASPRGLVAVEFGVTRKRFESALRERIGIKPSYAPRRLRQIARQIDEYLTARRRGFDFPIDWTAIPSDFQRKALRAVWAIPYGKTRTYAQIAQRIGRPLAARAVGSANASNPMPLVIPCHRVVGTDGQLHGYGGAGGLRTKAWLISMEHANARTRSRSSQDPTQLGPGRVSLPAGPLDECQRAVRTRRLRASDSRRLANPTRRARRTD